ncbi:MAG: hypothetical protein H7A46_26105 [Verrucomicrobiales bacterium]|nr:hypothetical protein [Verrucomicrobiales bacterium]
MGFLLGGFLVAGSVAAAGWQDAIIGEVTHPGTTEVINQTVLISGFSSKSGWGGNRDQCAFAYRPVTGDFDLTTRITDNSTTHVFQGCIMVRESLEPHSKAVLLRGQAGQTYPVHDYLHWHAGYRLADLGNITWQTGKYEVFPPFENLVRLVRRGDLFIFYAAHYAAREWIEVFRYDVPMKPTVLVGVSNGYATTSTTPSSYAITFEDVSLSTTLPQISQPGVLAIGMYAGLTLEGSIGTRYEIQMTTDPGQVNGWTRLTDVVLAESPFFWVDPASYTSPKRFYRAVLIE